ncbi:hypothetical protein PAXRUDRAFT_137914, partial [Paxillus rubicundulus Ve08.2h10]
MCLYRASKALGRVVARSRMKPKKSPARQLYSKGIYTATFRAIARRLVLAGCSQKSVGPAIQAILKALDMPVGKRCMSNRTVQRAVLEGGVAAKMQIGHEIVGTSSLTFSSDSTTHHHVNFNSRHISYKAPLYGNTTAIGPIQRNLLLGIELSKDHTAKTQVQGLKDIVADAAAIYNHSPLAQRLSSTGMVTPYTFMSKLKGVNGDHSADQLKMFAGVRTWKKEMWLCELGMQALRHCTVESAPLAAAVRDAYKLLVDQAGGLSAWNALSDSEFGKDIVQHLPEDSEERRAAEFLVRAGCCMHKQLNSVKGRNAAMVDSWEENGFERPILLANKDNAATLQNVDKSSDATTDAEVRALDISGHGGVKVCTLAGAIFNHKDDKKGQQDTHHYYFEMIKAVLSPFPDTSNTRYQSYCEAAAELLTHLDHYITFLEQVRDRKKERNFSHMEENVYKALHDGPTLTELAVLVLYAAAITHPHMCSVHSQTKDINVLDLSPLHDKTCLHCDHIIEDPTLLFGSYKFGALDGLEWQNPTAVTAVHQLFSNNKLPHLHEALMAFFRGALTTWEHFSAEFEGGGTIDRMSREECNSTFMSATNDANEGALGSYRLHARQKPLTSLHHHNTLEQFKRNNTESFIDNTFTDAD